MAEDEDQPAKRPEQEAVEQTDEEASPEDLEVSEESAKDVRGGVRSAPGPNIPPLPPTRPK